MTAKSKQGPVAFVEAIRESDLRSTYASDALASRVSVFELARVMGTSVRMIERHYGALLDGAGAEIANRLDRYHDATEGRREGSTEWPTG